MDKTYDHLLHEEPIYKKWETSNSFSPSKASETFSIIMPPPNANDPLHVGHALFVAVEDILTRYNRMKGKATLWLPGTDHAGIETQYVFEKKLAKQDKSRFDYDRETLYSMIWDYVQENSGVAVHQMKRLGASADWSRFTFTLDTKVVQLVLETFMKLYADGLVYRGERLVNYCTKCGTAYSDLEVDYEDRTEGLYFVRYQIEGSDEYVVIATTRPETIPVDTHVAVHPEDGRYLTLIGKTLVNPLSGQSMHVVADTFVEREFGTGVVKMTPAHDKTDWEAAERHGLPKLILIGTDGRLNERGGPLAGLKIAEARKKAVELLQARGLLDERTRMNYAHRVGVCYRCHTTIEILPLPQFFITVAPLVKKVVAALDAGETVVLGTGREKILREWLNNLKDWNISRQIVWGIRMPVWYDVTKNPTLRVAFICEGRKVNGRVDELLQTYTLEQIQAGLQELFGSTESVYEVAYEKPGETYLQETNTFDTWFSSGQWPVVTLKTTQAGDFDRFYPTTVMETGYDILPFWVMRMMLLCLYTEGTVPFKTVYLHGLVRDEKGQKMSKSKGNVINPLDMVEKYGADAIRMALVMSSTPGQDKAVGENTIRGMRNFSNKIWNAARFVSMLEQQTTTCAGDEAFLKKLDQVTIEVTRLLDELKIGLAAEVVYNEFWHWFCDEAIEQAKIGELSLAAVTQGLNVFLRLLHPFVPFVTEAVWSQHEEGLLMTASWPTEH